MLRKPSALSIVLWTAALVLGWAPTAQADKVFHTPQYPLSSVADGSVHGWVTDIRTQGPRIYAAGKSIATTGGHGDPRNGLNAELAHLMGPPGPTDGVINSVDWGRITLGTKRYWQLVKAQAAQAAAR